MSGLGNIKDLIDKNRKTLAVAGAGAVGVFALVQGRKRDGGAGAGGGAATYPGGRSAQQTGGAPTATAPGYAAPYDSSAQDLYNAIQSQTEYLKQLGERQGQSAAVPVPKYVENGIYGRAGGRALYQYRDGKIDWLENATVARQLGANASTIKYLSQDDDFWKLPKVDAKK